LAAFKKKVSSGGGGGGGGGTYALVTHATGNGASGSITTANANTTGAKLIVVSVSWFSGTCAVSDNKGNTYTALTAHGDNSGIYSNRLFYCVNPTVGSGHTVTATGNFVVVNMEAFSLTGGGSPTFDTQSGYNHNSVNTTTFHPGSVTPAGNNELFVTSASWNISGITSTIDSSFTITDQSQQGGNALSGGLAYKIQTTSGSENPTWTFSGTVNTGSASIAVFK
jgi:hypothetical protein